MTQVNTDYKKVGPLVKKLQELKINDFFLFPGEKSVYRILHEFTDGYLCVSLDDLQSFFQPGETLVEPWKIIKVDIQVELR